jgi:hypothetical protein
MSTLMTAEDLLALPDDDKQYELVEGELVEMSPASRFHSRNGVRIISRLSPFIEEHDLGEVYGADMGFILRRNPDTVRAPDVSFVRKERLVEADELGFLELAPRPVGRDRLAVKYRQRDVAEGRGVPRRRRRAHLGCRAAAAAGDRHHAGSNGPHHPGR